MIPDQELYEAYFQKDADYYIERVEQYDNGHRFRFNPYAFFLGLFWFLYRKMYLETFVICLLMVVEDLVASCFWRILEYPSDGPKAAEIPIRILMGLIMGSMANFLYIRKAKRVIAQGHRKGLDGEQLIAHLRKKGGVDYWRWILVLLVGIIVVIGLSYYAGLILP